MGNHKVLPLLQIKNLHTYYFLSEQEIVKAVAGLSLDIFPGEIIGLLGESGCGKTATALSIMQLQKPGKIVEGQIIFRGLDLLKQSMKGKNRLRGKEIAFIFQDPTTALNPVLPLGKQIGDVIATHHTKLSRKAKAEKIKELLQKVGLNPELAHAYLHQLSGGMKQRIMIALALAGEPSLLIADEPTTGLDVTTQYQILELLLRIKEEEGMTILLITHDLGVVAKMCNRVALMYRGNLVEVAEKRSFLENCYHPYARALISCLPSKNKPKDILPSLRPENKSSSKSETRMSCSFYPYCSKGKEICQRENPKWYQAPKGHWVFCHWKEGNI